MDDDTGLPVYHYDEAYLAHLNKFINTIVETQLWDKVRQYILWTSPPAARAAARLGDGASIKHNVEQVIDRDVRAALTRKGNPPLDAPGVSDTVSEPSTAVEPATQGVSMEGSNQANKGVSEEEAVEKAVSEAVNEAVDKAEAENENRDNDNLDEVEGKALDAPNQTAETAEQALAADTADDAALGDTDNNEGAPADANLQAGLKEDAEVTEKIAIAEAEQAAKADDEQTVHDDYGDDDDDSEGYEDESTESNGNDSAEGEAKAADKTEGQTADKVETQDTGANPIGAIPKLTRLDPTQGGDTGDLSLPPLSLLQQGNGVKPEEVHGLLSNLASTFSSLKAVMKEQQNRAASDPTQTQAIHTESEPVPEFQFKTKATATLKSKATSKKSVVLDSDDDAEALAAKALAAFDKLPRHLDPLQPPPDAPSESDAFGPNPFDLPLFQGGGVITPIPPQIIPLQQ